MADICTVEIYEGFYQELYKHISHCLEISEMTFKYYSLLNKSVRQIISVFKRIRISPQEMSKFNFFRATKK